MIVDYRKRLQELHDQYDCDLGRLTDFKLRAKVGFDQYVKIVEERYRLVFEHDIPMTEVVKAEDKIYKPY